MSGKKPWAPRLFWGANVIFLLFIFWQGRIPGAFRPRFSPADLAGQQGRSLTIRGRVCEEADDSLSSRRLTLCTPAKVLVTTDLYPAYDYGDRLEISGRLQEPPAVEGFDYASYLARYDIYSVMYYPRIAPFAGEMGGGEGLFRRLLNLKQRLRRMIEASLPEPGAGLANALLLGYRRTVMRSDMDVFARVGLSHMIAISGSHITILSAMIIGGALAFGLSRRRAYALVFSFLLFYPLITGLAASAVRSAIMGGLSFLALIYQRPNAVPRALVFSAALMLAVNPRLLRDDIGFQLSFLALAGIVYLYPLGEAWTDRFLESRRLSPRVRRWAKNIIDTANLCLVSQVIILPVALINFRQLSLIAPLANILVLWTFPPLLAALIIGAAASALLPATGPLFFLPAHLLLRYIFVVSGWLARPAWAAIRVEGFNWRLGMIYYLLIGVLAAGLRRREEKRAGRTAI